MSRTKADAVFSAALVLVIAWALWEAQDWPFRARLFPWTIGFPLLGIALLHLILVIPKALREERAPSVSTPPETLPAQEEEGNGDSALLARRAREIIEAETPEQDPAVYRRRAIEMSIWVLVSVAAVYLLGFKLGAPLAAIGFLLIGAKEGWKVTAVYAFTVYAFFLFIVQTMLVIPLPDGMIAEALGTESFDYYVVDPLIGDYLKPRFGLW